MSHLNGKVGFARFASLVSRWCGSSYAFGAAALTVIAWAAMGPVFRYSDSWQMLINTGTTICTFLMVFVIQNSQNRDGMALQAKMDELIRAVEGAKNSYIGLEDLSEEELQRIHTQFVGMATKAREIESQRQSAKDQKIQ